MNDANKNVNGFLLHYVGSLWWDFEILEKKMKKNEKIKKIKFDLNDANECEWFSSSLCRFSATRLRNVRKKMKKKSKKKSDAIWIMLMNVNGFLLHYVGSLRWDLEIFEKKRKKNRKKKIRFE